MLSFDRSHATSYSSFIVTMCLSHTVLEIWRDENNFVATANKKWLPWQRPLRGRKNNFRSLIYTTIVLPWLTRSSAIAEGPRDASCQLKTCQLPRNSAETTCTTNAEQIEVMKLEGYSGTMCTQP